MLHTGIVQALLDDFCPDVLWSYNLDLNSWQYISPSIERLRGYNHEEILQLSLKDILTPQAYENFNFQLEKRLDQRILVGVVRNISERMELQKQLEYFSMHDQMTGLYNRTYFEEEIRRLNKTRDYPITMLSADLNGLKLINDTMSHDYGDRLLRASADVLSDSLSWFPPSSKL